MLSLATHLLRLPAAPSIDPAVASRYLDGFVRLWDAHRIPGDLTGFGGLVVWIGLVVAIALLRKSEFELPLQFDNFRD